MVAPQGRPSAKTEPSLGPLFDDVRETLQISWVPTIFVALGEVPGYLDLAWAQLKPSLQTAQFARLAERVQKDTLAVTQSLYVPSYDTGSLQLLGVTLGEQAVVRTDLSALIFGQTQTLLAAKALRLAIEGNPPGGKHSIWWPRSTTTWAMEPIPTVDEGSVGESVRQIFLEVQQALQLPWTPRSLEVIARWPRYLRQAWEDLAGVLKIPEFSAAQTDLIEQAAVLCDLFPTRVNLTPDTLEKQGQSTFEVERARQILLSYDRVLPANLLLTACLRYPLGGSLATSKSW